MCLDRPRAGKAQVPKRADLADEEEKDEPLPSDEPSADEADDAEPPVFVAAKTSRRAGTAATARSSATAARQILKAGGAHRRTAAPPWFGTEVIDVDGAAQAAQDIFARAARPPRCSSAPFC